MTKERLSYGGAKHRRRELSSFRKEVTDLNRRITEKVNARDRLAEIGNRLSGDPTLSIMNPMEREQRRAEWKIEEIWLKFKLGKITKAEQQHDLSSLFDELEGGMPDVYHRLVDNTHGPSRAQQIRDEVIPQIRIAGFRTKR